MSTQWLSSRVHMTWKSKTDEAEWSIRTNSRVYLSGANWNKLHDGIENGLPQLYRRGLNTPQALAFSLVQTFQFHLRVRRTANGLLKSVIDYEQGKINQHCNFQIKHESRCREPSQALFDSVSRSQAIYSTQQNTVSGNL